MVQSPGGTNPKAPKVRGASAVAEPVVRPEGHEGGAATPPPLPSRGIDGPAAAAALTGIEGGGVGGADHAARMGGLKGLAATLQGKADLVALTADLKKALRASQGETMNLQGKVAELEGVVEDVRGEVVRGQANLESTQAALQRKTAAFDTLQARSGEALATKDEAFSALEAEKTYGDQVSATKDGFTALAMGILQAVQLIGKPTTPETQEQLGGITTALDAIMEGLKVV